jgi:hypothetical protein
MSAVASTVLPVFVLLLVGFLAGRTGYVSEAATKGLPEFVFKIVMPVLLARTIGTSTAPTVPPTLILAAFFGAGLATWCLATVLNCLALQRPATDAPAVAMAATFSNSVNMGLPICLAHFGSAAAPVLALIVLCDTATLWLLATLHYGVTLTRRNTGFAAMLAALAKQFAANPIILGCLVGLIWRWSGLVLPPLADTVVTMLAQAAIPGALVAMGLALNSYSLSGPAATVVLISALKLLVMPVIAYGLAVHVLALPALAAGVVTLLAAMPVAANAYLFAAAYDRAPAAVSGAIALSTPLSLVTLSALLLLIGGGV